MNRVGQGTGRQCGLHLLVQVAPADGFLVHLDSGVRLLEVRDDLRHRSLGRLVGLRVPDRHDLVGGLGGADRRHHRESGRSGTKPVLSGYHHVPPLSLG